MQHLSKAHYDIIQEAVSSLLFKRPQQSLNQGIPIDTYWLKNYLKAKNTNSCKRKKHVQNSSNLNAMFVIKDLVKALLFTISGISKENHSILTQIITKEYTQMCVGIPSSFCFSALNAIIVLKNLNDTNPRTSRGSSKR